MRNVVAGYRLKLCGGFGFVSFLSFFLSLTPYVNDFAKLPATLVSELGCHVDIHFKRVGFE